MTGSHNTDSAPDDADHDREGTEPDPEEAGRALWHMWRGVQKQNLDPGLVNEIAMRIVSQATVPVDLVEHLLDTHHNRAAIEMTAVENDALPIGLRERILAGVRSGHTLYATVGSATLPERLCRAAWEATFHLETGRSGDRETIDTLRAAVRGLLVDQPNCPPDIVVSVHWPQEQQRTGRWTSEQMRLAADLSPNWAGTFEELAAVVEN